MQKFESEQRRNKDGSLLFIGKTGIGVLLHCLESVHSGCYRLDQLANLHLSRVVRKLDFCICENKDADQLRGNREADQRLCFRLT